VNGDGIYGTRAWKTEKEGSFRFTTKGNTLYAIAFDWSDKPVTIALLPMQAGKVKKVSLLGHSGKIAFVQDSTGLTLTFPATKPCDYAYIFKFEGLSLMDEKQY
jgi:alpha-L-fucosidase